MAKKLHLVLVAGLIGALEVKATQILNIDTELAKPYVKDGALDPSPAAVKYYKEQGSEVVEYITDDEKAAAERAAQADALSAEIVALEAELAKAADDAKPALQVQIDEKKAALAAL